MDRWGKAAAFEPNSRTWIERSKCFIDCRVATSAVSRLIFLRNITADASIARRQFRRITAIASEKSDNFDEKLEALINEIKHSFDQMFANFARVLSQGSERTSGLMNAAVALAVCIGRGSRNARYYSTHDKTVADALLRAAHRIGLS